MDGSLRRLALPLLASLTAHAAFVLHLELPRPQLPVALASPTLHVMLQAPASPPVPQAVAPPLPESPPSESPPAKVEPPPPKPPEPAPESVPDPMPSPPRQQVEMAPLPLKPPEPAPAKESLPPPQVEAEPPPPKPPEPDPKPMAVPDPVPPSQAEVQPPPPRPPAPAPVTRSKREEVAAALEPKPQPVTPSEPQSAPLEAAMLHPEVSRAAQERASQDYFSTLRAYIEQHKRYPRRALMRRQEGTVLLRFTVDRQGRIVAQDIAQSSGNPFLDRAAEGMLERAAPLPAIPEAIEADKVEIEIPVSFSLG